MEYLRLLLFPQFVNTLILAHLLQKAFLLLKDAVIKAVRTSGQLKKHANINGFDAAIFFFCIPSLWFDV